MQKAGKRITQSLFKSRVTRHLLAGFIAFIIRLVMWTSRVEKHIPAASAPYMNGELPVIFTFWHGRLMLMAAFCPKNRPCQVMISSHRDGEWIAKAMGHFGLGLVRGSSRKGGAQAAIEARRALAAGISLAITPDGPKGPFQRAQNGAVTLSRLSQVPMVPCSFSSSRGKTMRSWDKFLLALPLSNVVLTVGEPIAPHSDAEQDETQRLLLEKTLIQLTHDADRLAGRRVF